MSDHSEDVNELFHDNFLLEDLKILLESIEAQIREVQKEALHIGIPAMELRTSTGDWPMRSLLSAKAQTLNAIVVLKSMDNYAKVLNIYNVSDSSDEGMSGQ